MQQFDEQFDEQLIVGQRAPVPPDPPAEHEIISRWANPDQPLVSVVIHTYQHVNYCRDTLNGVLMQKTAFPFEVIVHDDASTDGTREQLEWYAAQYPNLIRLVLQSENQFSRGRRPLEFSIPPARGKYIALCEGDDYWIDENKLQLQAEVMEADPSCSVCGHDAFVFQDGVVVSPSKLSAKHRQKFDSDQLKKGIFALTLTLMFVNRIKSIPPEQLQGLNGDKFLLSRLGAFGGYRYVDNIKPSAYRLHAGGVWSTLDAPGQVSKRITTLYWMSRYYRNQGDNRMEAYFISQIMEALCADVLRVDFRDLLRMFRPVLRSFVRTRCPRALHAFRAVRSWRRRDGSR